jgi:putative iron-dependent peroxidase
VTAQPGILAPLAAAGRYVALSLAPGASPHALLDSLRKIHIDESIVIGLAEPLVRIAGLHAFPAMPGPVAIPSTQAAVWVHVRAEDHGHSLRALRHVLAALGEAVRVEEDVLGFRHDIGRDLSGFEDGTENPKDEAAHAAAICADGSSFVAAQRWVHDLASLERLDNRARDALIGRNLETNEELADAPPHAHIKRAQQESFEPPAFMIRRSMPYGTTREHGLYFVAYVSELAKFERMLVRMTGADDGLVDGLFQFSRPVSGGYYWCPPVDGRHLAVSELQQRTRQ